MLYVCGAMSQGLIFVNESLTMVFHGCKIYSDRVDLISTGNLRVGHVKLSGSVLDRQM